MKFLSVAALASILSIAMARDAYFEHPRALDTLSKRGLATLAKRQSGNLAAFTGALGGIAASPITCSGNADRQFEVEGDTFVNFAAAGQRSCSVQNNQCSDAANAGGAAFTVGDCGTQEGECNTAQATAPAGACSGTAAATTATAAAPATTAATTASCGSAAKFRKNKRTVAKK